MKSEKILKVCDSSWHCTCFQSARKQPYISPHLPFENQWRISANSSWMSLPANTNHPQTRTNNIQHTHTHLALFYLALKRDWQWREICFYLLVCQRPLFTRRKVSRFDGGTRYNQHAELVLAVQLLNSVWLKLAGIPSFCLWLVVTVD